MRSSLDRLWLLVALALPALVALLVPLPAVDLAYQVRVGEMILATGSIPAVDTFTFTVHGMPWTDQQWLAQVLLALGHRLGGWELLAVLRAGLVTLTCGLLVIVGRWRGASLRTASILSLLAFVISAPALALRPQLFAVAVFAFLLVLVAWRERHGGLYLLAPVLVVLWANLHGSFVLAPLLLGYAWLDDVLRRRPWRASLAVLVVGTVATCVTPFGVGVWGYALSIGADPVISGRVSEWQRTSPLTPTGAMFYGAAIAAFLLAWRGRGRLSLADWGWLAGLTALGAWAERGAAWWPAGAVLVVAAALAAPTVASSRPPEAPRSMRLATRVLGIVLLLGIVVALPWWRPADPLAGRVGLLAYAPSGLAQAVRAQVAAGGRVVVPQTWGSWFEWAAPDALYFVDSRFELFPASVWTDYDAIREGGDAAGEVASRWQVDACVVPASWAAPSGAWRSVYADESGQLLVRAP